MKFLFKNKYEIQQMKNFYIKLKYIVSTYDTFSPLALKFIVMLESIFPKRVHSFTKLIILKFTESRPHTELYLKLNFDEFMAIFMYYVKKPTNYKMNFDSHLKEKKFFFLPSRFVFPEWNKTFTLKYENKFENSNLFLFHKHAFLD